MLNKLLIIELKKEMFNVWLGLYIALRERAVKKDDKMSLISYCKTFVGTSAKVKSNLLCIHIAFVTYVLAITSGFFGQQ